MLIAVLALASGTCGSGGVHGGPPTRREVVMRAVSFTPSELSVALGDTVVWRNADIVRHTAQRPELFDTGELRSGQSYAWIPVDTGTYSYRCTIHPRMRGRITITR